MNTTGQPTADNPSVSAHSKRIFGLPILALLLLILTAAISLVWSHHKLLDQDEFFVLQTDSAPSVAALVHIQHTYPISLDPLVYHLLDHAAIHVFGAGAFAIRLPSLFGYLLMQVCLFLFVRRLATERAGLIAMAFPAITATLFYSAEGRPYGLLLGFYALTLLSWHIATESFGKTRSRELILLALAIALTLNSHYFGVLLLIPLCAAELFRTLQRRRLDIPVAGAIACGMAAIAFALPFQKAAGEFRKHYYNAGTIDLHAVTQSYRALFVDYTLAPQNVQRFIAIAFVLLALALVATCLYRWRTGAFPLPAADAVFVLLLTALPFFGFLLAHYVTHTIEVRYVLGTIIGISILVALAVAPLLQRSSIWRATLTVTIAAVCLAGFLRVKSETGVTQRFLAIIQPTQQLLDAMHAAPDHHLYMQEMGEFERVKYYEPDPWVREQLVLTYSAENEIRYNGHDTTSLTAEHMRHFTSLPIVPYEELKQQPGDHVFLVYYLGWNWTLLAWPDEHATYKVMDGDMMGSVTTVSFPQK